MESQEIQVLFLPPVQILYAALTNFVYVHTPKHLFRLSNLGAAQY